MTSPLNRISGSSEDEVLEKFAVYKNFDSNLDEVKFYELEHQSVGSKNHEKSQRWNASQLKIGTLGCSI